MFKSGCGPEVAPEVSACPVLPGRFPVVPTDPWSVVPGLVPAYFLSLFFGTGPFLFSTRKWLPVVSGQSVLPALFLEVSAPWVLQSVVSGPICVRR